MRAFKYNRRVELPLVDLQQFDDDYIEPVSIDSQDVFMHVIYVCVHVIFFVIALCIDIGIIVYRFCFAITRGKEKPKPVATKEEEISLEEIAMCLE